MRFVDPNVFNREHQVQEPANISVVDGSPEHAWRPIGQNGCLEARGFQPLERIGYFRKWLEGEIEAHESLLTRPLCLLWLQYRATACALIEELARVARHRFCSCGPAIWASDYRMTYHTRLLKMEG